MRLKVFISSVQKEFTAERQALRTYIQGDALLGRFFETFLFEDIPAADQRSDHLYVQAVEACDLYLAMFGDDYGWEDYATGLSPTHQEFIAATNANKEHLIFVKGNSDSTKHPKMQQLIATAGDELIRRRFNSTEELITAVYASLIKVLEVRELIRFTPFDATACRDATLADLDMESVSKFLILARRGRNFPLPESTPPKEVLTHLNLLNKGRPTHAAILLFGRKPQRFLINSEVRCAHFHGFEVEKPIPSYQVYKGTLFDLIQQAKDFVLSKIDLWTGDRSQGVQVPTAYEIPQEAVAEAIVNAICHRDYTSNASVQVMLFKNRLEIWNPGSMPLGMTLEKLKQPHHSIPTNPLIAEPLYLTKNIERMGTGILDIFRLCKEAGLPDPTIKIDGGRWVTTIQRKQRAEIQSQRPLTGEVTAQVTAQDSAQVTAQVAYYCSEQSRTAKELMDLLGLKHWKTFQTNYLAPALQAGLIEMTIPDKPTSRLQKYRLTAEGQALLVSVTPQVTQQVVPQVVPQVTPQVKKLLDVLVGEMGSQQIMQAVGLESRKSLRISHLQPAMEHGLIEMTQPDSPTSPTQKYRLTSKGRALLTSLNQKA